MDQNKQKSLSKKKNIPSNRPPPPPSTHHNEAFTAVPSPSLHNLPVHHVVDKQQNVNEEEEESVYTPTTLSTKRLMLEIEKYLFSKPPLPHKPSVQFVCHRNKFITDLESRFVRFGHIQTSAGSMSLDLQDSISNGVNWMVNKTTTIQSIGSMIANGFKKKPEIKALATIPPPLLIIYLDHIQKAVAEEFAECVTLNINQSGVIISVAYYGDDDKISKWLNPESINATKIGRKYMKKEREYYDIMGMKYHNPALNEKYDKEEKEEAEEEVMHENDYAYNPDLESEVSFNRSVLRVCVLLYDGEMESSERVNALVEEYEKKYNLKSLCGVEMKRVSEKPPVNKSEDCPHCYVGNIFFDEEDGIIEGQESIFDSIVKCVFSSSMDEFEDDEINLAIETYENKNGHR